MRRIMVGLCAVAVAGLMPGCKASSDTPRSAQAGQAAATAGKPVAIAQILLAGEGDASASQSRPEPTTPDTPVVVTVALTAPAPAAQSLSLRLIDLSNGKAVGERVATLAAGQQALRMEFKPAPAWTQGRHLLEARIGQNGAVFHRDFDVMPGPAAKPAMGS